MYRAIFFFTMGFPHISYAHVGHLGALAGHDHWVAAGAIAAAALAAWLAGRKTRSKGECQGEIEAENEQEAS